MGDIDYARDLPAGTFFAEDRGEHRRTVVIERATFERIGDYTRSQPTGPSPGRVYRKNLGWAPEHPDRWFVYWCQPDPTDPKFTLHYPFEALIV